MAYQITNISGYEVVIDSLKLNPGESAPVVTLTQAVAKAMGQNLISVAHSGSLDTQPTTALYVDTQALPNGNGSLSAPFNTIMAAVNALTAGTVIYLAPGDYAENLVWRDLEGTALIGASEINTTITNLLPGHTFSWVPGVVTGAGVTRFAMDQVTLINTDTTGTYQSLHVDASAVVFPNTFCADEFDINTVDCDGSQPDGSSTVLLRNIGNTYWTHGGIDGGDITVANPSQFICRQLEVGTLTTPRKFHAEYNGANPANGGGRSNITIAQQSVVYGDLDLVGHPIFQMDQSSMIVGNVGGTLTSYYASGKDYCPVLSLYGQLGLPGGAGGSLSLTFPNPQTAGAAFSYVDLSKAHILGSVSLTKTDFLPATTRGYAVVSGQADFHDGTISVSGYVNLDLTGAIYSLAGLTASASSVVTRIGHDFSTVTASRNAQTVDNGSILKCNHATVAVVLTINSDATTGWSKSELLTLVQYGAAAASFAAGAGVTLRGTAPTPAQYAVTKLRRIGVNEWVYC